MPLQKLPPFTIRENPRAKRILVRYTDREGLLVVIPKGTDRSIVPPLIERNLGKIEKILGEKRKLAQRSLEEGLLTPTRIHLACIGQRWNVLYRDLPLDRITCRERQEGILAVEGPKQNNSEIRALLRGWLISKARSHLPPMMNREAKRCGLSFKKLQFRIQKTRWGSRSASGTISLNANLLFLEPHLARHVMIHELCHSVHMNHSPDFWSLVSRFDRDWRDNRTALREASRLIPLWIGDMKENPG